jgi:hypothetical protein
VAWALSGMVLFSASNRAAAQYMESFAPALAVVAGVGMVELSRQRNGAARFLLPLLLLSAAGFAWWSTQDYPLLRTATNVAAGVAVLAALVVLAGGELRRGLLASERARIVLACAALGPSLAVSLWITRDAPGGGQITRPNPVVYAADDGTTPGGRTVPAEAMLRYPARTDPRYRFAIDGMNNAGEAIAFTGASVLPLWNEYQRRPVLDSAHLETLLVDGDVPYVLLSQVRLRAALLDDVAVVVARRCSLVPRAPGIGVAWALYRCPGAAP